MLQAEEPLKVSWFSDVFVPESLEGEAPRCEVHNFKDNSALCC